MVFPNLVQDLRYTARTLRRDAGFAVFAILIAGLGIGASVIVFSVVNTLLLRPLPFARPSELVWIANRDASGLSRPDDPGRPHAGPAGAIADAVRDRRLLRLLRRRRQPAERPRRTRAAERRAGVGELLRRARREADAGPRVQRAGDRLEGPQGGDARLCDLGAPLQSRPEDRRHRADHQRRAAHRGRRAAGVVRLRHRLRAGQPVRSLFPVPAQPRDQSLGQHHGDDRPAEGRRHGGRRARGDPRAGAADRPRAPGAQQLRGHRATAVRAGQRQRQARRVGARRRRGDGDADRLRQPVQPPAGADGGAAEGSRHPHGARRRTAAAAGATADGGAGAVVQRGAARTRSSPSAARAC